MNKQDIIIPLNDEEILENTLNDEDEKLYLEIHNKINCSNVKLKRATSKPSRATSKTSRATSKPYRAISKTFRATSRSTSKTSRATSKTSINKLMGIDKGVEGCAGDEDDDVLS